MSLRSTPALSGVLFSLLCASPLLSQAFFDARTLNGALDSAREKGTIVMIAILMPGERGSDSMIEERYADAKIVQLARNTVNLKIVVGPEGTPPEDERLVRQRYLKVEPTAAVAAPNHLFVDPGEAGSEGTLLSSFAYEVTAGQLEWAWVDAIRKVKKDFAWELSERARAPESLLYGVAGGDATKPAPNHQQVLAAIKELKAGGFDFAKRTENYRTLLASDDPEALKFGQMEMRNLPGGFRRMGLMTVGMVSPKAWHGFAEEFLGEREADMREEAARTLESLAEPKSLGEIRKQYGKEKEPKVRGRLLRAMVATGGADKNVAKEIEKVLQKDKDDTVRVQAAVAAAAIEDRDTARRLLSMGLADASGDVRTAATYGIASRREPEMKAALDKAKTTEKNIAVSQWMSEAIAVIDGGELSKFDPFRKDVLGDRTRAQLAQDMQDRMQRGRGRNNGGDGQGAGAGDPKDPGSSGRDPAGGKGSDPAGAGKGEGRGGSGDAR